MEEDTLEARKRKLLEQSDWVGLAPSRPLHMRFPSLRDKDQIGKRRRIDGGIGARRVHLHREGQDGERTNRKTPPVGHFMSEALGGLPESISVRIGDDVLASQMSAARHEVSEERVAASERQRSRSETMLLDLESHHQSHHLPEEHHCEGTTTDLYHEQGEQSIVELENVDNMSDHISELLDSIHYPDRVIQDQEENAHGNEDSNEGDEKMTESGGNEAHRDAEGTQDDEFEIDDLLNQIQYDHPSTQRDFRAEEDASRESSVSHFYPIAKQPFRLIFNTSPAESLNSPLPPAVGYNRESSPASVPDKSVEADVSLPAQAPEVERGGSKEESWKRFVFGDDDDESTPSESPREVEDESHQTERVARPLASSLFVGASTSSGDTAGGLPASTDNESYQHANSRRVSTPDTSKRWGDRSDHYLNEASLRNNPASSDAASRFRPDADPSRWGETTSLALASMLQNLSGSSGLSRDAMTGTADANQAGGQSTSIRRTLFSAPKPFVGEANPAKNGPLRIEAHAGVDGKGTRMKLTRQKAAGPPRSIYDFPIDEHEMLEDMGD